MYHVFVIKDEKDASFGTPVFSRSLPDALRSLTLTLREGKSTYAQFPADFSIWRLGAWHEDSGQMDVLQNMEWITSLISLIEKPNNGPTMDIGKEVLNGHVQ